MYAQYLKLASWVVIEAADGRDGLIKALAERPDLIVVATRLSGISGSALRSLLRRDVSTRAIPIVAVSGDGRARDVEVARAAGATSVLVKPCLPETLHMHDPDVARQRSTDDMLHWLVFNIPGSARELAEGVAATPQLADGAVQIKNGGGTVGYRGPGAPAVGPHHHYTWELFALDTKLELTPDATRADVLKAIDGHILGKGVLVGRFHR